MIHILPFFSVDPDLGSWRDVKKMGDDFQPMFDLVLNHVSVGSEWFKAYLGEKEGFNGLAIEEDPDVDFTMVTRPESLPLI